MYIRLSGFICPPQADTRHSRHYVDKIQIGWGYHASRRRKDRGICLAKKISCCTQCNTTRGTESSIISLLLTMRDRSFDVMKLLRISSNHWTTLSIVGRLDGSTRQLVAAWIRNHDNCIPYLKILALNTHSRERSHTSRNSVLIAFPM